MKRIFPLALLLLALPLLALSACAPMKSVHGNLVGDEDVAQIKAGQSTRSDVLRLLGSPTTIAPFDDNTWFYIGQRAEKHGIFDPKVTDERVLTVKFDANGTVIAVTEDRDNPQDIPIIKRHTPTYGTETSPVQEFFGNLGKFNPPEKDKK